MEAYVKTSIRPSTMTRVQGIHAHLGYEHSRRSVTEMRDFFQEAIAWIESCGVRATNTRLDRYRSTILRLISQIDSGRLRAAAPKVQRHLYEISELIRIFEGLSRYEDPLLQQKLKILVGGPEEYSAEKSSSNDARN